MAKDSPQSSPKRTVLIIIGSTIVATTLLTIIILSFLIIHQEKLFQSTETATSQGLFGNSYHRHRWHSSTDDGLTTVLLLPFAVAGATVDYIFH